MDWSIAQTPENGRPRERSTDYWIAAVGALVVWALFAVASTRVLHWFIVPVFACAILIGVDAVRWARRVYDTFDPKGFLGLYGVNYFFISVLMVAVMGVETPHLRLSLPDYRPWLGLMATVNMVGLVLYRLTERWVSRRPAPGPPVMWVIHSGKAPLVLIIAVGVALGAQLYLFATEGLLAIAGVSMEEQIGALSGKGLLRMPSRALPFVLLLTLITLRQQASRRRAPFVVVAVLFSLCLGWVFITLGLTGMRTHIILTALIVAGILHYFWRRISRTLAIFGVVGLLLFGSIYYFYKHGGTARWIGFRAYDLSAQAGSVATRMTGMLVGDLSRTHVQAYMAYVLVEQPYPYAYRWGWTAVGDVLKYVPAWLWQNRWNRVYNTGKVMAMTDMAMGEGHYDPARPHGVIQLIGGLGGYTMLNFGILPIPLGFVLWGVLVGKLRRGIRTWPVGDLRFFLAPFLLIFALYFQANDLDNMVNFFLFTFSAPLLLILLIRTRYDIEPSEESGQETFTYVSAPVDT